MYFLIRTNVEGEGWFNDGIFAPKEAGEHIAAMLRTEQIAFHEGHSFEYRVYALEDKQPVPFALQARPTADGNRVFYFRGEKVLTVPLPAALDY